MSSHGPPRRGARLAEALEALVTDGTLDKVAERELIVATDSRRLWKLLQLPKTIPLLEAD